VFGGRIDIGAVEYEPAGFLAGDYNRNGVVDLADYSAWRDMMGQLVPPGTGADGNGDGVVNQLDYEVWKSNFGATLPAIGAASVVDSQPSANPEAANAAGVGVAAIGIPTVETALNSHTAAYLCRFGAASHARAARPIVRGVARQERASPASG
jgi:hypothetical protein